MEWIWNPLKKRVGKYKLNTQLSPLDNLTLLNRYDYEDWDTYAIMNSNNSKLFIKNNEIKAIQCGLACCYNGINIIGLNYIEASNLLEIPINLWVEVSGSKELIDDVRKIRLYAVNDKIVWVIIHSW